MVPLLTDAERGRLNPSPQRLVRGTLLLVSLEALSQLLLHTPRVKAWVAGRTFTSVAPLRTCAHAPPPSSPAASRSPPSQTLMYVLFCLRVCWGGGGAWAAAWRLACGGVVTVGMIAGGLNLAGGMDATSAPNLSCVHRPP
jgi:hypothetical protein